MDNYMSINLKKSNSFANSEYSTWNAILEGKINSEIVIYGSSRAWVHIDPTMISNSLNKSTYNLGIDGHNFWLQYLRHTLLLKHNTKPKLIILSLDVFTLQKINDLYNLEQFLPYMLWNDAIKNATKSYNGFTSIDYEIPLVRYLGRKEAIKESFLIDESSNIRLRVKGFQAKDRQWNSDFEKAKKAMKNYDKDLDSNSIKLFERFLTECKSNNIDLLLVYTPEYIEGQKFIKNRTKIISLYKKYGQKFDIPFYDYSDDSITYHKKYFYNSTHMNKEGAKLFTKKLIDSLKIRYHLKIDTALDKKVIR